MSHAQATRRPGKPIVLRALTHQALGLPLLMAVLALAAALVLPVVHRQASLLGSRPAATTLPSDRQELACRNLDVNNRHFSGGEH